jgi:hypothetical protein
MIQKKKNKEDMTEAERKEANRYYWIVKGHLIPDAWSEKDIMSVHNSYFDRIWGNHENVVHEDGFEEAYLKKYKG